MTDEPDARLERVRREPPPFRRVAVREVAAVGPRLLRVTLGGPELAGFERPEPAASVRLLLPSDGRLVVPTWEGNEFLLPDGRRPTIRTFTPRRFDVDTLELDVEIVVHGDGAASRWAAGAGAGAPAAVSGPGRGHTIDLATRAYLIAGDETALPAVSQLLEALAPTVAVDVHIEVAAPEGRIGLPAHPRAEVSWHVLPPSAPPGAALVEAIVGRAVPPDAHVWVAGEAAAVHRVRRYLFEELRIPRRRATVRGYWKHGRAAGGDDGAG